MKRLFVHLVFVAAVAALAMAGCAQATPAPTPVQTAGPAVSPAVPTKVAEPTKPAAPTAAPTKAPEPTKPAAAPAKKVDFPVKGRSITLIVPSNAGGSTDVGVRLLAPAVEKELGVPFQVVNRPGAGQQVGITELAMAKPDGYTLGMTNLPSAITLYLEPSRKAAFGRKDLQPVAAHLTDPIALAVNASSPYKTMKDLVDAAKAKPETIKVSAAGIMTVTHLPIVQIEKMTGAKFATVQFSGGAEGMTALFGGHVDVSSTTSSDMLQHVKSGQLRILGIADKVESKFYPGVPTLESQGYKLYFASTHGASVPAGTPREIVDILSGAIKTAMADAEYNKKMTEMGLQPRYLGTGEYSALWDELEREIQPLISQFTK